MYDDIGENTMQSFTVGLPVLLLLLLLLLQQQQHVNAGDPGGIAM